MEKTSDDGWWMVQMTVFPFSAKDLSTVTTFCAMKESRPDVGSSQNISGGFVNTYKNKLIHHCILHTAIASLPSLVQENFEDGLARGLRDEFTRGIHDD